MKRKREMEESEIRSAIDELSMLTSYKLKPVDNHDDVDDAHYIPTMVFISICNSVLQVLGNLFFPLIAIYGYIYISRKYS